MRFGICYTGIVFLVMLFIPNIIWTKNQPQDYSAADENKLLLLLERTGQVLVTVCSLIFADMNIHRERAALLCIAFALMVLYEIWWMRYFRSERKLSDFYSSIMGIPLAGAVLPVVSFLFLGLYGMNLPMIISAIILGIGHIGIHAEHARA